MKISRVLILACFAITVCSFGEEPFFFSTILTGTNEVPPVADLRTMRATFALSGHTLECRSEPAHYLPPFLLRGPAAPGTNGPDIAAVPYYFLHPHPPPAFRPGGYYLAGELSLTDEQIAYLFGGLLYVEADGQARGQILLDTDLDFVPDSQDQCPNTPSGGLVDSDGCTLEQLCPCEAPWKSHGEYVSCMQSATAKFVGEGLITEERRLGLLKQAAQSDCGKSQRN